MNLVLVGQQSGDLTAFVPPVSIEDCPLLWTLFRSQTCYLEHIHAYGSGRLVTLLSWVPTLSGPTVMVDYWVGGLSTALRPGLKYWGLGVLVSTGT
jgi:hypothetical protein